MTARPDEIADRPDRTKSETFRVDALSDVLRAVRLTGAVFFDIGASAPWVAETPPGPSIVKNIFPDAGHLIPYHVVTQGTSMKRMTTDKLPSPPASRTKMRPSARRFPVKQTRAA